MTPADIMAAPASERLLELGNAGLMTLLTATHIAIFSAVFALVAILIASYNRIHDWIYYAIAGNAIALLGFIAQYYSETPGDLTIVNTYAFMAYALAGFAAGLVYWYIAGRGKTKKYAASTRNEQRQAETVAKNRPVLSRNKNTLRDNPSSDGAKDKKSPSVKFQSRQAQDGLKSSKHRPGDKAKGATIDNKNKIASHENNESVTTLDKSNEPDDPPPRILREDPKAKNLKSHTSKIETSNDEIKPTNKITLQEALDEYKSKTSNNKKPATKSILDDDDF